jgi:HAE1 family hydrophobic/amphiphilic exporter-1
MKGLFTAITRLSVRFKWVTILIAVLFMGLGVYAALQMRQELLPNIQFPQTFVLVLRPGASSDDLRDLVTIPLEQEAVKIKGVIPAGLESTTVSPIAFLTVRSEYGSNQAQIQTELQTAIDKVVADGVPLNLKTTADLTPDILKHVLTRAPSMWEHFESQHILAMSPELLDAAFSLNPAFATNLDRLTSDQLAAERLDTAMNGTVKTAKAVDLPGAWALTAEQKPKLLTFDLSALPVISASVFSKSADMTQDELKALVTKELVDPMLNKQAPAVAGVADAQISGGEIIPKDVHDAALVTVQKSKDQANAQPAADGNTQAQPAAQPTTQPSNTIQTQPVKPADPVDANGVPLLPGSWTALPIRLALRVPLNNADDLFNVKDLAGNAQSVAETLNQMALTNPQIVTDLNPTIINYIKQKESDFTSKLSDRATAILSPEAYAAATGEKVSPPLSNAWTQLAAQPGFKALNLTTVRGLRNAKAGASALLNALVKNGSADFQPFVIRLVSSLTPDAIDYLATYEEGFLSKLDPAVLRYFSAETLKSIETTIDGLQDAQLKADLKAIIADPTKAAAASLKDDTSAEQIVDDPNAPVVPENWGAPLKAFGVNIVKADDFLKHPVGQKSAADFLNLLADRGAADMVGTLSADVLIYINQHETTFFASLKPTTIGLFSKETLAKLPTDVQDRAQTGPVFVPTHAITRTNGQAALTVTIYKEANRNTVEVSDNVDLLFHKFKEEHPNIGIEIAFEQASFIKESISGVAREGGLGAVMAVIVILLFLNFSVRSTLVTAVSIPTSIAIAFVLMQWLPSNVHQFLIQPGVGDRLPEGVLTFLTRLFPVSITLNIMTLSGLTVAIGRVVDDAIVVLENIYRHIQDGDSAFDAVVVGTRDVSVAIFAATLTTVVVFLPIGLAGGVIGEFFLPFGLAVTYSLIASFLVAITIVPTLAFMFLRKNNKEGEHEGRLEHTYHNAIDWALSHRVLVLGGALLTLVLGGWLFSTRPTSFLPALGEPQITVAVSMPPGTPIAQTDVRVEQLEDYLKTLTSSGVTKYQVVIGSGGGLASFVGGGGVDGAAATITIAAQGKDADGLTALTGQIRAKTEEIFGSPKNVKVSKGSLSDQGFGGFAVQVTGPQEELVKINDQIIAELSKIPGLANVTSSLSQVAAAGSSKSYLRVNQTPSVTFTAELETADTLGLTKTAIERVKAMPNIPTNVSVGEGFQSQTQTEGFSQMVTSLGIAVLIVYLVMVITFGSLIHPFTILFSLPLAVVGAALALTLTNRVLGISAMIGMLMLVGIVVTNAIVLIDRVQANRKERGMSARDALIEGGRTRLRPILMTAIATMFALLPLAIGLSQGAIIASELGTVVIGGLFSSTLLTLLVVPVVYSLLDQAQRAILRQKPVEATSPASGD